MFVIEKDTIIKAPIGEVWKLVSDPERMPEWAGMRSVVITSKSDGLGLTCTCDFGRFKADEEVTEWEEGRRIAHDISAMGMRMREVWTLDSVGQGTRLRWRHEVYPRGFRKILTPMIKSQLNKSIEEALGTLARKLETQPLPISSTP